MAHLKIQPPGISPLVHGDRKPVIRVIGGDSWTVTVNLFDPLDRSEPATPENSFVTVKLSETQFDSPLWTGEWYSGVTPDEKRPGLCHIEIPREITAGLRRGSYMFSVRVSDLLKSRYYTEAEGSFLLEYSITSDQHSIPYKDGTTGNSSQTTSSGGSTPVTPSGGGCPAGGKTGQVLIKRSDTDYDAEWRNLTIQDLAVVAPFKAQKGGQTYNVDIYDDSEGIGLDLTRGDPLDPATAKFISNAPVHVDSDNFLTIE